MKQSKILFIVALVLSMMSLSLYAQNPLANNIPASGVLGQADLVSKTTGLTASTMNGPKGIALDPTTGKIFVADYENRRVLRWSSADKMMNGAAAEAVLGQPDFVTNTSGTSSTKLARPYGMTVDASGRLYVADLSNHRVLRFDNASTLASGSAATRVLGQPDFATGTANTGGISASTMSSPIGVYVDGAGRLWVTERDNKRITRFDNAAAKSNGDPADGVLGEPNFTTNTGGRSASLITRAYGVTGDASGRIWVADRDNNRVLRFDSAATKANGAAANGVIGQLNLDSSIIARTQSGLEGPRGVFIDATGRLYVNDEGNNRILVYNGAASKSNGANADHAIGQTDFISASNPNPPTANSINYPEFLVVDNAKNQIWLADEFNHRILRYDLSPRLAVSVLGQTDLVSKTTGLTASTMNGPKGIALDPTTGKIFVADYENRRVLRWSSADKMMNGAAAEAVLGQPDFVTNTSGTSSTKLARPYGMTVDASGRLYVADLSNHRVLRFDNASTLASGSAATRVLGQPDFATGTANTGGISASTMSSPIGVYVDGAGRLWVTERDNKRITRFDNAAAKSNGDPADGVLGEPNFTTNTGGLTASLVTRAYGITGDASGRIWVSDRDNNRVLRFDGAATKANGAAADGVIGQTDFVSSVIARTQSGLEGPRGVFINSSGRLYVSDEGNNRIMVYDSVLTSGNGQKAINVLGQTDFISASNANPPTAGSINYPEFLVVDNFNKHIWLADEFNHRILRYDEGGAPIVSDKVTFQVNMKVQIKIKKFNKAKDTVVVRGDFQGWGGNAYKLADPDGDSIYVGIFSVSGAPKKITYKYVMLSPTVAGDQWETSNDRVDSIAFTPMTLPIVWFNKDSTTVYSDNFITFQVNMKKQLKFAKFDKAKDSVVVRGDFSGWSGNSYLLAGNNTDSIYKGTFNITSVKKIIYKFVIHKTSGDTWQSSPDIVDSLLNGTPRTQPLVWFSNDSVLTGVSRDENVVVTSYELLQNYPNPFNPATKINFSILATGWVSLKIYNVIGQEVATIVNQQLEAGRHIATFNASNLTSGVYFYKIESGSFTSIKKMMLLK